MNIMWDITNTEEGQTYIKNNREFKVLLIEKAYNKIIFYRIGNLYVDESQIYYDEVVFTELEGYLKGDEDYLETFLRHFNGIDWLYGDSFPKTRYLEDAISLLIFKTGNTIKDYITKENKETFHYYR